MARINKQEVCVSPIYTDIYQQHKGYDNEVDYYTAYLLYTQDYYPFGMGMPGRSYNSDIYRFGYNGKENDNEAYGVNGALQDYGMRMYDTRVAKFVSIDPLMAKYPSWSPFAYCLNSPIKLVDPNGKEVFISGDTKKDYFKEVKKGAAALGIRVKMDKNGQLNAKYKGKGEISSAGKLFMDAVNDITTKVNMNAANSDYADGTPFVGGAFMVNLISYSANGDGSLSPAFAEAFQTLNPKDLKTMDDYYGKSAQTSIHEITEAYKGVQISFEQGVSSGDANAGGYVYNEAHSMATPPSVSNVDRYQFDKNGNQSKYTGLSPVSIGFYFKGTNKKIKEVDYKR